MSEVQPGLYEIISCIGPTGVHNPGPTPDEVVRVNQPHLVVRQRPHFSLNARLTLLVAVENHAPSFWQRIST